MALNYYNKLILLPCEANVHNAAPREEGNEKLRDGSCDWDWEGRTGTGAKTEMETELKLTNKLRHRQAEMLVKNEVNTRHAAPRLSDEK